MHRIIIKGAMFVSTEPFTRDKSKMSRDKFHLRDARHKRGVVTSLESDIQVEMSRDGCGNIHMHRNILQGAMFVSTEPFTRDNSKMSRDDFHRRNARHIHGELGQLSCHLDRSSTSDLFRCI